MNAASFAFRTTREDIEGLRYLNDARKAAHYLGIPEVQVEDVWAEMRGPRQMHSGRISYSSADTTSTKDYADETRPANEVGSERLKAELLQSMLRWAQSNGTGIDEAAAFLMSGVRKAA